MHSRKDDAGIGHLAVDVARAIIPVDPNGVDWVMWLVFGVKELHDACQVIRFPRRLADEIYMVYIIKSATLVETVL